MKTILKTVLLLFILNVYQLKAQTTDDALKINDNGNVGINTSTPTEKLEINGNLKVSGNTNATNVAVSNEVKANTINATNLSVNNEVKAKTINATGTIQQNGYDLLPEGVIVMWYGAEKIPEGWIICDGADNKTPDLRDKFVVGASDTKKYKKDYGNNKITIKNLPQHEHDVKFKEESEKKDEVKYAKLMPWKTYQSKFKEGDKSAFDGGGYHEKQIDFSDYIINLKTNGGNNIPTATNQEEFIPKSYALIFIMKSSKDLKKN